MRLKSKGYTLIEILVVMTIGIIIFSVGIAGYRNFSRRQDLAGVTKNLESDLRLIQQKALTGQKPDTITCNKLVGYTFAITSSTGYKVSASCDNNGTPQTAEIKSVELNNGVTLTSTKNSILFKVLGLGTDLSVDNIIRLTNSNSGNQSEINIGKGGDIR